MAIAFDAASDDANGGGTGSNMSWTHTPVGTPKGAVVQIAQGDGSTADEIASVTYGGTSMTRVTGGTVFASAGAEDGSIYTYFLGSSVPTGAQTVAVTVSGSSLKRAVCCTVTASGDTVVDTSNTLDSAGVANPSLVLSTTASRTTFIMGALHSGQNAIGSVAVGADYTEIAEDDLGSVVVSFMRRTSNGSGGSITVDWTAASEEAGIGAIAIAEVVASTLTTTATDSIAISDTFDRLASAFRDFTDSLGITDDALVLASYMFIASDSFGMSDTFSRLASAFRTAEDSVVVSDVFYRVATFYFQIADTLGIQDAAGHARQCLRTLSDSIAASDDVTRLLTAWRSISDSILASESVGVASTLKKQYSDSVAASDTVARVLSYLRSLSDSIAEAEAFARQADAARTISDSMPVSDVFARQGNWQRTVSDTLALSEAYRQIVSSLRGISDSLGISDTAGLALRAKRAITDTLGLSDSVSRETVFRRALSEFVVLSEAFQRNADANRSISDTLAQSETVGRLVTNLRSFSDTFGLTDTLASLTQAKRGVSDSVGLSDDAIRAVQFRRAISESIPLREEFGRIAQTLRAITDSIGLSDTLAVLLRQAAAYIWDAVLETRVWTGSLDMVNAPEVFEKQPSESDTYAFDFTDKLTSGESLSSGATVVATPAGLTISGVTISGARVECAISGGSDGQRYALEASAVTSLGQTIQCDGILVVRRGVR